MPRPDRSTIKELGVGGAIVLGVLYIVFNFLVDLGAVRPAGAVSSAAWTVADAHQVAGQIDDLYEWHDRRDLDGILRWYVPRSMTQAVLDQTAVLRKLREAIVDQTTVLGRIDRREEQRSSR